MDEMLKKIIDEKTLTKDILEIGLNGYCVDRITGGYLYRFLLKDGSYREAVNLSSATQKIIKV